MKYQSPSWLRVVFCALWSAALPALIVRAEPPTTAPVADASRTPTAIDAAGMPGGAQTASVDELKDAAYKAFSQGKFDQTSQLLKTAAAKGDDPTLQQMVRWVGTFNDQRKDFQVERRKAFDKDIANVHKLLDAGKPSYAMDWLKEAYVLADDGPAFRNEPWVDAVVQKSIASATSSEDAGDWLTALRLYADLGVVEPSNPKWKDELKVAIRRIRLLAVYTPDLFKLKQDADGKERDEVDALVLPTTQPAHKPATQPGDDDAFKTDWHDSLHGIQMDMLRDALLDSHKFYFRDVSYQKMLIGGLEGIQAVITTPGLEQAFPKLADPAKRQIFAAWIDQNLKSAQEAQPEEGEGMLSNALTDMERTNSDTLELPEEVLVSEFADGAFGELDPFSNMIWPSDMDEFNKSTQGEFSGIGVQIQLDDDGELKVVSPLEDSPAYKLGIQAGDVITRINGKNAKGITTNQAVKNITGPPGTTVNLTMRGADGVTKDYTIRRETIHVASLKGWKHEPGGGWDYFIDPDQKIAYLHLTNFTKSTEDEMDRATAELKDQGARAIILDLRYNPGGLLTAACAVSDKFLRSGVIVSTRPDRDIPGQSQPPIEAHDSPDDCDLPLVVLVNQYSASASEIVSGALKDQHRATIIGERTFGKGSVQMLFPLSAHAAYLKLTTSHYYLPSGRCIHREENSTTWGVDPDLRVEMTAKQMTDAIEARQDMDVLRESDAAGAAAEKTPTTGPTTRAAKKDVLEVDPQLSAALLELRLKLAGTSAGSGVVGAG